MTRALHVVLPMAGRGSRFLEAGIDTPKPLIEVDGIPMFIKAISSLETIDCTKLYTLIIRKEHQKKYNLMKLLKKFLPLANIVVTDEKPNGATVDALRSRPFLITNNAVIVMDCDLWFESSEYSKLIRRSLYDKKYIDGALLTFGATDPRYSYAQIGADHLVSKTAEKRVISNNAIVGAYFFASVKTFISAAETLTLQPLTSETPEYYLSLLYNILIDEGKKIKAASVDKYASFGTPKELAEYQKNS